MGFKEFLKENEDLLAKIKDELQELDSEELDEFGYVLYNEFFDEDNEDESDEEDEFTIEDIETMVKELGSDFYEEILDMLSDITEEDEELEESSKHYIEVGVGKASKANEALKDAMRGEYKTKGSNYFIFKDLDTLIDALWTLKDWGIEWDDIMDCSYDEYEEVMNESVSRILKAKNKNKKRRKFMQNSKAELRRTQAKRKKDNRANKASRKRYYRANKTKIKAYQKSRKDAIKKGSHKVKLRRKAG